MTHQDPNSLRLIIDPIEASSIRNGRRDQNPEKLDQKTNKLEESYDQINERVSRLESIVLGLTHQMDRAVELEYYDYPSSRDGQARCNYEELD